MRNFNNRYSNDPDMIRREFTTLVSPLPWKNQVGTANYIGQSRHSPGVPKAHTHLPTSPIKGGSPLFSRRERFTAFKPICFRPPAKQSLKTWIDVSRRNSFVFRPTPNDDRSLIDAVPIRPSVSRLYCRRVIDGRDISRRPCLLMIVILDNRSTVNT